MRIGTETMEDTVCTSLSFLSVDQDEKLLEERCSKLFGCDSRRSYTSCNEEILTSRISGEHFTSVARRTNCRAAGGGRLSRKFTFHAVFVHN